VSGSDLVPVPAVVQLEFRPAQSPVTDGIKSSCEVNRLIDGLCGICQPSTLRMLRADADRRL
jgi:hypothetical protein